MLNHWLKGKNDYPVRCDLLEPILNERKDAIGWQPTDKFIYAKEIEAFSTEIINNGGRLVKVRKGAIETQSLKEDEITPHWKVIYDGKEFLIDRMTQRDDEAQQVMLSKNVITTRLYLKG